MRHAPTMLALGLLALSTPLAPSPASAGQPYACNGKAATIVVDSTNPDQQGTTGDDVAVLLDGGHDFNAGDGADTVCSYHGQNTIRGGPGDDFLSAGGFEPSLVYGGHGDDVIFLSKGQSDGQTTAAAGPGDDRVTASFGNFDISLGRDDDTAAVDEVWDTTVRGGPGNDTLRRSAPGEGADSSPVEASFFGGRGRDVLSYRSFTQANVGVAFRVGSKHIAYGFGSVTFRSVVDFVGSHGNDLFEGSAVGEHFWGLAGNDVMYGRGGNDLLFGGRGDDHANGGAGRDTCRAEHRTSCERG